MNIIATIVHLQHLFFKLIYNDTNWNWYPADLFRRAKINSVLDWHHSKLRPGAASAKFVLFTVLGSAPGIQPNPQAASEAEKILSSSLSKLKSRDHLALGK
ncbi:glutathione S-transferase T1 isoform X1 [Cannabis sativa]|uniref:glutathione S-transferase T1 isoform X1 n=1 Tax=Cannabis sativa TaxID=3483 RepID=UPI0029C9BCFE|nr:glutathione S-transferase T1 isoform X1 [Cannabis sativa]